jgi:hypothetical protein
VLIEETTFEQYGVESEFPRETGAADDDDFNDEGGAYNGTAAAEHVSKGQELLAALATLEQSYSSAAVEQGDADTSGLSYLGYDDIDNGDSDENTAYDADNVDVSPQEPSTQVEYRAKAGSTTMEERRLITSMLLDLEGVEDAELDAAVAEHDAVHGSDRAPRLSLAVDDDGNVSEGEEC